MAAVPTHPTQTVRVYQRPPYPHWPPERTAPTESHGGLAATKRPKAGDGVVGERRPRRGVGVGTPPISASRYLLANFANLGPAGLPTRGQASATAHCSGFRPDNDPVTGLLLDLTGLPSIANQQPSNGTKATLLAAAVRSAGSRHSGSTPIPSACRPGR